MVEHPLIECHVDRVEGAGRGTRVRLLHAAHVRFWGGKTRPCCILAWASALPTFDLCRRGFGSPETFLPCPAAPALLPCPALLLPCCPSRARLDELRNPALPCCPQRALLRSVIHTFMVTTCPQGKTYSLQFEAASERTKAPNQLGIQVAWTPSRVSRCRCCGTFGGSSRQIGHFTCRAFNLRQRGRSGVEGGPQTACRKPEPP